MLSVITFIYPKVLPHKLKGGIALLKAVRTWEEGCIKYLQLKFIKSDFYGPSIELVLKKDGEATPEVEPVKESYCIEDISVAIGIDKTVAKAATEIFAIYGKFYLVSKYGKILIEDPSRVEETFSNFKKQISLF